MRSVWPVAAVATSAHARFPAPARPTPEKSEFALNRKQFAKRHRAEGDKRFHLKGFDASEPAGVSVAYPDARKLWVGYREVCEEAIGATAREDPPRCVVASGNTWCMPLVVSAVPSEALQELAPHVPEVIGAAWKTTTAARARLAGETGDQMA
ncbi:hypothetical protein ACRDNQ_06990 [Palleronia sp. KMU-117]|uniref:hypothetical protein n=1 Tax=Palleronia sp. KMU-117 TaxID=3434108 RepID=UPI003D7219D7